jgi:hypothetical protein
LERNLCQAFAQPGIAADRFAREIVGILKASTSTLAAAECQTVGRATKDCGSVINQVVDTTREALAL